MVSDNRDISTFNGAQLKLFLIDEIRRGIIDSRHKLDIRSWLYWLQDFDNELEGFKKKGEEREKIAKSLKELTEKVNKSLNAANNPLVNRHKKNIVNVELIEQLDVFYKDLLKVYHDSGLEARLEEGSMGGFGKT